MLLGFLAGRKQHGSSSPAHVLRQAQDERGLLPSHGSTSPTSSDSARSRSSPRAGQKSSLRAGRYERVARALGRLAIVLFILAMPVFLVTSNVRMAFDSLRLYRYGFERYDVVSTTGLDMEQLMTVAREFRDYFHSSQELLDVRVTLGGEERALFNQREVLHMRDVKGLVRRVYRLQEVAGAYIAGYVVVALLATRGRGVRSLAGRVLVGSVLTVGLLALGGVALLVGFDRLFQVFHILGFPGGNWSFDPRYNYLTRLFTEGFFMDATLLLALATVAEALLLALVAWGIRKRMPGSLRR
ncbi:MAG: family rane protein [Dehalococcoidia bacterium]|nr:family rane protein [Dehalococcoidia bacterium]